MTERRENMAGILENIFITPIGGTDMQAVVEVEAIAGEGLLGDRYCQRSGHWTGIDKCEVTLMQAEDLEAIIAHRLAEISTPQFNPHRPGAVQRFSLNRF